MTTKARGLLAGLAVGAVVCGFMGLAPSVAHAQQAAELGTFNAWTAWKGTDASGEICYISGQPRSSEPTGVNRDPVHFLIIHRKGMGTKNEVQTLIGYPFSTSDAKASATIDNKSYPMVAQENAAWLASTGDEPAFVAAFRAGSSLVVRGTSQRGTNTVDTYSLSGSSAAMDAIDQACQ